MLKTAHQRGFVPEGVVFDSWDGSLAKLKLIDLVAPDGDIDWWASNAFHMSPRTRARWVGYGWTIEHYHRGIKPFCGVEHAQRNHIGLCLRAFLRLERRCYHAGIS